ncbi:hypothetical protein Dimus_006000 [Dionaea muscipula]
MSRWLRGEASHHSERCPRGDPLAAGGSLAAEEPAGRTFTSRSSSLAARASPGCEKVAGSSPPSLAARAIARMPLHWLRGPAARVPSSLAARLSCPRVVFTGREAQLPPCRLYWPRGSAARVLLHWPRGTVARVELPLAAPLLLAWGTDACSRLLAARDVSGHENLPVRTMKADHRDPD